MNIKSLIKTMKYKAENIKAHIEPEVFKEVVSVLEKYDDMCTEHYKVLRENYDLKHDIGLLREGLTDENDSK